MDYATPIILISLFIFGNLADSMPDDAFYGLKLFSEDIKITFEFDQAKKEHLIENRIMARQHEIENCKTCNSDQLQHAEDNRKKKIEELENMGSEQANPIIATIKAVGEWNDLQIAIKQFQSGDYKKDELQSRVNSLISVKTFCSPIDIADLEKNPKKAYQTIQDNYCPVLKAIPAIEATSYLDK